MFRKKGNLAGSCQDWTLGLQDIVASTILASSSSYLLGRQCLVLPQESQISKFLASVECFWRSVFQFGDCCSLFV